MPQEILSKIPSLTKCCKSFFSLLATIEHQQKSFLLGKILTQAGESGLVGKGVRFIRPASLIHFIIISGLITRFRIIFMTLKSFYK